MRYLPIKALFFSLAIHLVVLNVFVFTVPLSHVSLNPSFIFLGPILKQEDVGGISQQGNETGPPLLFSGDTSGAVAENFFSHSGSVERRFIQGTSRPPVSSSSLRTGEKIVTKSFFDISADVKQERTESVADQIEADHEIAPYKPLGLFPR